MRETSNGGVVYSHFEKDVLDLGGAVLLIGFSLGHGVNRNIDLVDIASERL